MGNRYQPDPAYFDWGSAFQGGIQQAHDNQRRNAMLDLDQRQVGMQEQRLQREDQRNAQQEQDRAAAMQAAQEKEGIGIKALAAARGDRQSAMEVLQKLGLPVELADDPDAPELYGSIAEKYGGFQLPQQQQPKLVADHTGVLVPEAPGVRPYREPKAPPSLGALYQVVGPDGPQYATAQDALGQMPYNKPTPVEPKPPSEADKKIGVLYGSMIGAENAISRMKGADTSSKSDVALGSTAVTSLAQSNDFRKYESAAKRWASNLLYIKSGATATPEEVNSTYKQFFPQPGDSEDVKKQKAQSRQEELGNIRTQYPETTGRYQPASLPAAGQWSITKKK